MRALVVDGLVGPTLKDRIEVRIRPWVYQEVVACPSCWVRVVVVVDGVSIEELAHIICRVACGLKPDGQIVLVKATSDKFGVAACFASASRSITPSLRKSTLIRLGTVEGV